MVSGRIVVIALLALVGTGYEEALPKVTVSDHDAAIASGYGGVDCESARVLETYRTEEGAHGFLLEAACELEPENPDYSYVRDLRFLAEYRAGDDGETLLVSVRRSEGVPTAHPNLQPTLAAWRVVFTYLGGPFVIGLVLLLICLVTLRTRKKHQPKATAGTFSIKRQFNPPVQRTNHWTINRDSSGGKAD